MADNVTLNAGSGGVTAATDDCGAGGHTQIVKLAISTDGSATLIPATAAAGMLVDQSDDATRDNGIMTVDNGGTFAVQVTSLPASTNTIEVVGDVAQDAAVGGNPVLMGGRASSAAPTDMSADGDSVYLWTTLKGALNVADAGGTLSVDDGGGNISIDDGGNTITVDGTVAVTNADLATIAGAIKAEDVASAGADPGIVVMARRTDTPAAQSGTDGDYEFLQVTGGRLAVQATGSGSFTVAQATAANLNCTEASAASIATNTSNAATSLSVLDDWDNGASDGASVSGDVAHDTADAGEPVKIGAKAETAPSGVTAVADGDRTNLYAGADGILYVRPYCALEDIVSGVDTDTAGDSTSVISAPGAGIRLYITSVIVKNSHASTDAYVDIRDGTAGSVLATIPAPAAGGAVVAFPVPLRLTANTACAVDPSAAVSTIITTVVGFKAAV